MTELFAAVCSIAPTRRRRFFWAAWWTAAPASVPFRKPDAASGGARSHEEALAAAERAAGRPLTVVHPRWARAAARWLRGEPPWSKGSDPERPAESQPEPISAAPIGSIWHELGLEHGASIADIKLAYRRRALAVHPDRGGTAEAFRRLHSAYEEALRRRTRDARRPARKVRV